MANTDAYTLPPTQVNFDTKKQLTEGELGRKLYQFSLRRLTKGEKVLLAKALCDRLPLMPAEESNIKLYVIHFKPFIDDVIYGLRDFIYIDSDDSEYIVDLIVRFMTWRAAVAYNTTRVLFTGNPETVIDDFSLLPLFIDQPTFCALTDSITDANYYYRLFTEVCNKFYLASF